MSPVFTKKLTPQQIKRRVILLVVLILLTILSAWGNLHLTVTNYTYSSDKLPEEFSGFRIVQISDFHNSNFGPSKEAVVEKTSELNPDIIVITGDIIDSRNTHMDRAVSLIEMLSEIAPVYYINGNHECRFSAQEQKDFYSSLEAAGATVLNNASTKIYPSGIPTEEATPITLVGINDDDLIYDMTASLNPVNTFNLVLAHEPQSFDTFSNVDLMLSGHAHGGQIRIPFTDIGLVAPDQGFIPRYTSGIHTSGNSSMIVSRGIGNSAFPVRVFNYPEIVVIDFE